MGPRKAIIILGMHRSGTSPLSRLLSFHGFRQPSDLMPPKKDNPKGFWESVGCQILNDRILFSLGGAWDNPGPFLLPGLSLEESRNEIALYLADRWGEEARNVLQASFGDAPAIVLKDPRIGLFLPLWQRALKEAGYHPYYVLAYRNPLEVAGSLSTRNGMSASHALRLWMQYNLEALIAGAGMIGAAVAYEDLLNDPDAALKPIFTALAAPVALNVRDQAARTEFLFAADRHHVATAEELERSSMVGELVKELWNLLRCWNWTAPRARLSAVESLESEYKDMMQLSGAVRIAPEGIVARKRTPGLPNARSAQLATAPSARLFTSFGTVIYVDLGGLLRHGPIEGSPANAAFVANASWTGSRRRGSLVWETGGARELIACSASRCVLSSTLGEHNGSMMQTEFEILPLGRGLIAFRAGELFLCAEPDGRITLSRTRCSTWECFLASESWCAETPSGLLKGLSDIAGMNFDRAAIENLTIPEVVRAHVESLSRRSG